MLREAETRSLINVISKRQTTFFDVTTGMIEGRRSREKQLQKILDGLTKWLKVASVTDALKTTRGYTWKVVIAYVKE